MKKKQLLALLPYALLILLGIYAMWSLTVPGLYKAHDTIAHISRLISFEQALQDGQFPPRWAGYFFGGLGSPVLSLNYSLPYFMASIIHSIGFSLFDSYKLTLALSYIASGVAAYLAFKTIWGKVPGFVGAILYMWAPYRFLDIYVRSAFGESVSFLFPPLILLAIHKRWWWLLIISFAGMFLTHPVTSAFFVPFFFLYSLIYFYQQKQMKDLVSFFGCFVLAFGLSAFNILPSLLETRFTHYAPSNSEPLRHFPTFLQLIRSPWGYGYSETNQHDWLSFQLGAAQWLVLGMSSLLLLQFSTTKKTQKGILLSISALLLCWLAIFLMIPQSLSFWKVFNIGAIIDFPWRITIIVVFLTAYLGAWLISTMRGNIRYIVAVVLIFLALYGNRNHLSIIETLPYTQTYFRESDQTGDDWGEYASIYRKTRTSTRFPQRIQVVRGEASLKVIENKSNYLLVEVVSKKATEIRFNIMYFPGWRVWLDNKELNIGKECQITTAKRKNPDTSGLLLCRLPVGKHMLSVRFMDTPLRTFSNLLTCVSGFIFLCLLSLLLYQRITKRKISFHFWSVSPQSSKKRKKHLK